MWLWVCYTTPSFTAEAMSKPQLFLGFDDEAFFPGQEVTGVLVLVVTQPVKALSLKIHWCVFV